jgi:hypothetical protein
VQPEQLWAKAGDTQPRAANKMVRPEINARFIDNSAKTLLQDYLSRHRIEQGNSARR